MKKMIMMIILGIILSSCGTLGLARYGIEKTMDDFEIEKHNNLYKKKEGGGVTEKDEMMVEKAIKDISKRAINKKVQFGEGTLIIPQNTRINFELGNIVDEKTGYGILVILEKVARCSSKLYTKKIQSNIYIELFYSEKDTRLNEIINKLIRANGFTRTCN